MDIFKEAEKNLTKQMEEALVLHMEGLILAEREAEKELELARRKVQDFAKSCKKSKKLAYDELYSRPSTNFGALPMGNFMTAAGYRALSGRC